MRKVLYQDTFSISSIDKDGKKFDRVSRLEGRVAGHVAPIAGGAASGDSIMLDFNSELLQLEKGQKISVVVTSDLDQNAADAYEYVMYGKVYKFDTHNNLTQVYVSFGGLLLSLESSNARKFSEFDVGNNVYLMLRKM
ncbi:hypothetical protein MIR68_005121 [Amoeboaphelidium protococcarum]|nr:hypothetical protein MIR68_005121 [Amoeboaphelidium protococcarum]